MFTKYSNRLLLKSVQPGPSGETLLTSVFRVVYFNKGLVCCVVTIGVICLRAQT